MSAEIINKIDQSGLITLDLSSLILPGKRVSIDMADWLDDSMIIRERSFKERLSLADWSGMKNCFVSISSSKDVVVPPWAYLLIQTKLHNIANQVFFADLETMNTLLFKQGLDNLDLSKYTNQRVFLKVCSNKVLPLCAMSLCAHLLMPHVKSLFYGEPCSGVPLIKN